jgi:hypothetical protein
MAQNTRNGRKNAMIYLGAAMKNSTIARPLELFCIVLFIVLKKSFRGVKTSRAKNLGGVLFISGW